MLVSKAPEHPEHWLMSFGGHSSVSIRLTLTKDISGLLMHWQEGKTFDQSRIEQLADIFTVISKDDLNAEESSTSAIVSVKKQARNHTILFDI